MELHLTATGCHL